MLLILISLYICVTATVADKPYYHEDDAVDHFENFIQTYNKTYPHEAEKLKRFDIFKENLKEINRLNTLDDAVFGINPFTDLTYEEMKKYYMGFDKEADDGGNLCKIITDNDVQLTEIPTSLDYREKNAVTKVKDQDRCGSCWIFGSIGSIEGSYAMKHNKLKTFSEQQLLDCLECGDGCNGGRMKQALSELVESEGVELDSEYPYEGNKANCRFNNSKVAVKVTGCIIYNLTDERKMQEVLVKNGPITIAVNGYGVNQYHSGILNKISCPSEPITHAVLLVGYGTESGKDYWIIKNSWGELYGEKGFVRITRGDNTCGLMNDDAVSAVVA